jgi:hypothetical protein
MGESEISSSDVLLDASSDGRIKNLIPTRWSLLLIGLLILFIMAAIKTSSKADAKPEEFWTDTLFLFGAEVGVALIVAFFVGFFIERDAKRAELALQEREAANARIRAEAEARAAEERNRLMANNVIEGVYGLRHDGSYVRAVIDSNLNTNIVRDQVSLDYTLSELTDDQAKKVGLSDAHQRFVILTMISSYTFENLSGGECECSVRYSVATRHGDGAKEITRVTELVIDGKTYTDEEIADGLEEAELDNEKNYIWPNKISAGKTLPVRVTVTAVKERSDNEVWGSFFPTVGGLSARFQVLPGMVFGLRPLLASPLRKTHDQDNWGKWETSGPVLPNNSAVFWWRIPEDDARPNVNPQTSSYHGQRVPLTR